MLWAVSVSTKDSTGRNIPTSETTIRAGRSPGFPAQQCGFPRDLEGKSFPLQRGPGKTVPSFP